MGNERDSALVCIDDTHAHRLLSFLLFSFLAHRSIMMMYVHKKWMDSVKVVVVFVDIGGTHTSSSFVSHTELLIYASK